MITGVLQFVSHNPMAQCTWCLQKSLTSWGPSTTHLLPHLWLLLLCFILPYCRSIFRLLFANSLVLSFFKSFLKSFVPVPCAYIPHCIQTVTIFFKYVFTLSRIKNCFLYLFRLKSFAYTQTRQNRICFNSLFIKKKVCLRPSSCLLLICTSAWFCECI